MHNNYFFLKSLANELQIILQGSLLAEAYSQDADELILGFTKSENDFFIKCHFKQQDGYVSFPKNLNKARKNFADLLEEVVGKQVTSVEVTPYDRSFYLNFESKHKLLIKLHGKYTNVILFEEDLPVSIFKSQLAKDWEKTWTSYGKAPVSKEIFIGTAENRLKLMPWLGNLTSYLPEDFEHKPAAEQWADIETLIDHVDRKGFILNQNAFQLEPNFKSESVRQSPIDLCNQLCHWVFTAGEKQKLLLKLQNLLEQARNRTEKELFEIALRLETLEQNPYEKLANNLMANLHQLQNDKNRATILDVYANQAIEVKLPEGKTWTSYANQLYQKAKNSAQEVQVLKHRQKQLEEKQKWLLQLEPNDDWSLARMRETEQQLLPPQKSKLAASLPFHEIEMAGFTMLIGKNSAANDLLLKNYSKPNDLWLHARDLAGSHVIIKNPAKAKVPQVVITRAAELAAWFSKGKNLSNCPVMVTERKFVRKFKGALQGQVKVEREKTIFAQPKNI